MEFPVATQTHSTDEQNFSKPLARQGKAQAFEGGGGDDDGASCFWEKQEEEEEEAERG